MNAIDTALEKNAAYIAALEAELAAVRQRIAELEALDVEVSHA